METTTFQFLKRKKTDLGTRNLEVNEDRGEARFGQLTRMIDRVAVKDDQLQGPRQFENPLNLRYV